TSTPPRCLSHSCSEVLRTYPVYGVTMHHLKTMGLLRDRRASDPGARREERLPLLRWLGAGVAGVVVPRCLGRYGAEDLTMAREARQDDRLSDRPRARNSPANHGSPAKPLRQIVQWGSRCPRAC